VLHEFREDPSGTLGVYERDEVTVRPRPRLLVDQLNACCGESRQLRGDVARLVGDVVEALSPTLEESADGGVWREGLEQLNGADEGDTDSLRLENFGGRTDVP